MWISSLLKKTPIIHSKSGDPVRCYKLYTFSSEHQNESNVLKYKTKLTERTAYTIKASDYEEHWDLVTFQTAGKSYEPPLKGWLEDKSCRLLSLRWLLSLSRRPKVRTVATRFCTLW